MSKITRIQEQKKDVNRVSIFVDDEFRFGMMSDLILKFDIYVGKELTEEEIEEILVEDSLSKGLSKALNYISYQQRTEKEVYDKLIKLEYDALIIKKIIDKLKGYKYINDPYYAKEYIGFKVESNGPNKIKLKLRSKGIDTELIQNILDDYSEEYFEEKAMLLGEKKNEAFSHNLTYDKRYTKLSQYLISRGYEYSIVKKVVKRILEEYINIEKEIEEVYIDEELLYIDALTFAKKKLQSYDEKLDQYKKKEKLGRFLIGKRYSYEIVKKVIKELVD